MVESGREEAGSAGSLPSHHRTIYRYILSIVGDADEAKDLTQETFLRAHDKLSGLQDRHKLLPWLYRIATNCCYDHFRQASFRRCSQSLDAERDAESTLGEPAEADAPRLDKLMEQDQMSSCVQKYLMELPDAHRAVILLRDAEGLSNPEVADMLGISLATAKIRLHRARAKLRSALNDACLFSIDERGVVVCDPKPVNIKF